MPVLADEDVVVHGNGDLDGRLDHLDIARAIARGRISCDKTLRINNASGATDLHKQRAANFEAALCGWMGRC